MSDSHPTMTTSDTETPVLSAMPETEKQGGCSSPSNCWAARYNFADASHYKTTGLVVAKRIATAKNETSARYRSRRSRE